MTDLMPAQRHYMELEAEGFTKKLAGRPAYRSRRGGYHPAIRPEREDERQERVNAEVQRRVDAELDAGG